MPSGTSYFDWTVFKKTLARFWPVWGTYLAIWLIVLPFTSLMRLPYMDGPGLVDRIIDATLYIPATSAFWGLFSAMAVLSHLYSARSANFFAALPIRREGMFFTQFAAGLCFMFIPNLVVALLTGLVGIHITPLVMGMALRWLLAACLESLFFFSLAFLCGMIGHLLSMPVFYLVFNFIAILFSDLLSMLFQRYYFGFRGFTDEVTELVSWLTPAMRLSGLRAISYRSVYGVSDGTTFMKFNSDFLITAGVYTAAALVMMALSFMLYRRRRMENSADMVSVDGMRPVFKYSAALASGLFLGWAASEMLGRSTIIPAMLIFAVIGYFGAQMILDRSFRVFKKWPGAVAVAAVFIVAFLVVGYDLTGFETRVPDPEDVESVDIMLDGNFSGYYDSRDSVVNVSDRERIQLITRLHSAIIDERDTMRGNRDSIVRLTYHTKSGTMLRSYGIRLNVYGTAPEGSASDLMYRLLDDNELTVRAYGFDRLERALDQGGSLTTADFYFQSRESVKLLGDEDVLEYYNTSSSITTADSRMVRTILDAVEQDLMSGDLRPYSEAGISPLIGCLELGADIPDIPETDSTSSDLTWIRIAVPQTAKRTIDVLKMLAHQSLLYRDE